MKFKISVVSIETKIYHDKFACACAKDFKKATQIFKIILFKKQQSDLQLEGYRIRRQVAAELSL